MSKRPASSSLLAAALVATLAGPVLAAPAAPTTPAPTAPAFTLEHALTLRSITGITWSRDGSRVAFVVSTPDTAENTTNQDVWLWEAATNTARPLTRHAKNDYAPQFSPTGDTLAFLSNRDNEEGKPSVWLLPLRGGEPWRLATFAESVGEFRWSPDGRSLAYTMLDTLSKQVRDWRKKKWDHVVEDEILQYNHLWVYDLASGQQRRVTSGRFMVAEPRWSPDSRTVAFLWNPTGAVDDGNLTEIALVPAAGGEVRRLGGMPSGGFAWSPDGRWLAWAGGRDRDVHVEPNLLWVVSASGGAPRSLTDDFDEDAFTPVWNTTSDSLHFVSQQGASVRMATVALAGGPVRLGADLEGETAGAPVSGPGGRMALVLSRATRPNELWVADGVHATLRRATDLNATAAACAFGPTTTFRWKSDDGVHVEGVLVRPAGAPERSALKTLVLLHGGPYQIRYGIGFQAMAQYMAARGYQVFMPNFRSSGGYGKAFMVRQRADWGGEDWRDVERGVDALIAAGLAKGDQLGVFGHSYGGYLSAWAITQTHRYDAAIVSAGAPNLASLWAQSDTHRYRAYEFEGTPWESPHKWRASSPITHIGKARTPTLVLIGQNDQRIPFPQGQETYQSLKFLGVPTEFVHYPREGHGIREPRHRADWMMRQAAWFDRWVK